MIITGLGVGGTELALLSLVEHCDRSQYEFDVVCLYDEDNRLIPRFADLGISVTVVRLFDYTRGPLFKYSQYRFLQLVRLLRAKRYDLVHTLLPQANRSGGLAARLAGVPGLIATVCNMEPERPKGIFLWLDRMLGRVSCATVCKSPAILEHDRQIRNLPLEKYRVIYNGIDTERFDRRRVSVSRSSVLGVPIEGYVIGSVGRLHPQKAHDTLIEAYSIVRQRLGKVTLVIVGDGRERAALERRARDLGVSDGVVFLGVREDIPEVLSCVDVFALASLFEGHPNALLEALSMELPVVVTDIGPFRDVVAGDEAGVVVPLRAPKEMAAAIEGLLLDEGRRRSLGAQGRRVVVERFSIRKMVQEYERLYAECAQCA